MSNLAEVVQNHGRVRRADRQRYAVMLSPALAGLLYNALVEFVYRDKGKDSDWVNLFETMPGLDAARERLFEVNTAPFFRSFYGKAVR